MNSLPMVFNDVLNAHELPVALTCVTIYSEGLVYLYYRCCCLFPLRLPVGLSHIKFVVQGEWILLPRQHCFLDKVSSEPRPPFFTQ